MTDLLQQQQADPVEVVDPNKSYFEDLVGEGKKFKTQEDLAKGKVHADHTVEVMKRRLDQLTADYQKVQEENITKAKLETLYDKFAALTSSNEPPANANNQPTPKPLELDNIDDRIAEGIRKASVLQTEQNNLNTVQSKLTEHFGPNYQNSVKQQIDNMGLSSEDFHTLARKSPQALLKALGVDQPRQTDLFQTPPRSSQRTDSFAPSGAKKRTWAYYQELKKANPSLYLDRDTGVQMQKDAIELGEVFRDGDYYRRGLHEPT